MFIESCWSHLSHLRRAPRQALRDDALTDSCNWGCGQLPPEAQPPPLPLGGFLGCLARASQPEEQRFLNNSLLVKHIRMKLQAAFVGAFGRSGGLLSSQL